MGVKTLAACMVSSAVRRNYLSNIHMIIFSAAVSADVSPPMVELVPYGGTCPPLADDSAACILSSLNRKNYLSNFHMIIFSAAVSTDVSPPMA